MLCRFMVLGHKCIVKNNNDIINLSQIKLTFFPLNVKTQRTRRKNTKTMATRRLKEENLSTFTGLRPLKR